MCRNLTVPALWGLKTSVTVSRKIRSQKPKFRVPPGYKNMKFLKCVRTFWLSHGERKHLETHLEREEDV